MASSGPSHVIARRAIDEIAEFSRETETMKYMKVFIMQEIAEARRFIRTLREEAQSARSSLAQVRAMVVEMEATNDQDEYYDSLSIAATEEEINTLESHMEIMDAAINSE
ncbi:hypothetical protein Tco_1153333 [Tanacetum coccineum]